MPRFQFSLKALFATTTLVAGIVAMQANGARAQKQAVDLLTEKGCSVAYRHQEIEPRMEYYHVDHPAPEWLRELVGDDFFRTVTAAWIDSESFTDHDLEILTRLPKLNYLFVSARSAGVTEQGLKHFRSQCPKCFVQE